METTTNPRYLQRYIDEVEQWRLEALRRREAAAVAASCR
jgi:hypothetical protein